MSGALTAAPLRVGFVAWRDLGSPQAGGSEVAVDRFLCGLQARGHDVRLMCGGPVGERPYPVHDLGGTYAQYLRAPFTHARRFRDVDVLVDVQNGIPFFSPLWRRKPSVCLVHHVHTDQWGLTFPAPVAAVGRTLESQLMPRVYRRRPYVAISPGTQDSLAELGIPREQVNVVTLGVDLESSSAPRSEEPMFLALGRLVPHKRIDLLLKMWERVRPLTGGRLVIAGDGPERGALEALAGEGVELRGSVTPEEKQALLSSAWALVHPAHHEGWGMVVLEAAAVNTPTVAFNVTGIRDTVGDGISGLLVDDEDAFVQRWVQLATEPRLREQLSADARPWAERFSWDQSVERFEAVLHRAVRGDAPVPGGAPALS